MPRLQCIKVLPQMNGCTASVQLPCSAGEKLRFQKGPMRGMGHRVPCDRRMACLRHLQPRLRSAIRPEVPCGAMTTGRASHPIRAASALLSSPAAPQIAAPCCGGRKGAAPMCTRTAPLGTPFLQLPPRRSSVSVRASVHQAATAAASAAAAAAASSSSWWPLTPTTAAALSQLLTSAGVFVICAAAAVFLLAAGMPALWALAKAAIR